MSGFPGERRINVGPPPPFMGDRRKSERKPLQAPLPAGPRPASKLPDPSDWSFELIEQYHEVIRATARRFGLDTYANQLEIITSEQMMDAYASVGMPVNYRHWSYGKEFIANEKNYKRGQMGLAYEIVINSDPCISYLMEENTTAMQALVIAHAAYGHNSFFKGNYLFKLWTDASSIIDYLVYSKNYIAECEEQYGLGPVEELLDSCHALQNYGVDRYRRPSKLSFAEETARRKDRLEHAQSQVNDIWRTLPKKPERTEDVANAKSSTASDRSKSCSTAATRCRPTASTVIAGRANSRSPKRPRVARSGWSMRRRRSTTSGARCRGRPRRPKTWPMPNVFRPSCRRTSCISSKRTHRCSNPGSARSCASCARSRSTSTRSARRR